MEIHVLGPLEVLACGTAPLGAPEHVPLGAPKQQTMLALLAVNANRWVGVEELVDELWPLGPPASARANVGGYAAKLRRVLAFAQDGQDRLIRRNSCYMLRATPDEIDLPAFEVLAKEGRAALGNGEPAVAAARLGAACRRWRGTMLAGIARGSRLHARCEVAEQERVCVTEDLARAYLTLNQPDKAVRLLREHVRMHPLREAAHALLMRALYRSGDSTGALASFGDARRILVDQLGIEPGADLQELQRGILNRDRALGAGTPPPGGLAWPARPAGAAPPREVPPDVGHFVGRASEADQAYDVLVGGAGSKRRRPALVVVHGPGGAGKSALAIRIAHRVAGHFPDGQLYVDLAGSTSGLQPPSTADVLGRLLRSLGVPPGDVPRDISDAAARLRTVTADRCLLMVLDNADDAAQVNALLPAGGSCGVVVTARRRLSEVDADCRLRVTGLSPTDGAALLRSLTAGVVADRPSAERIVDLCEGLPLAIRIAAARLDRRPDLSPRDLAERLADGRRRLDELELDGLAMRSCVRAGLQALAASGRQVRRLAAQTLRTLAFLDVARVDEDLVGDVLGGGSPARAGAVLDVLVGEELVEPVPDGGYRLRDLVRLVAVEEATAGRQGGPAGQLVGGAARRLRHRRPPPRPRVAGVLSCLSQTYSGACRADTGSQSG